MNLTDRMAGIDASLDDLQSGVEASSRAAGALRTESAKLEAILKQVKNAPLAATLLRHAADVQQCAREQRAVLQDLRDALRKLRLELKHSNGAGKRVPPAIDGDGGRR
jgi:hypothetical protein